MKKFIISLLIIISIITSSLLWSFYEYENIDVNRIDVSAIDSTSSVPPSFAGKKIVFVSDFQYDHRNGTVQTKALEKAISLIKNESPDIILFGGDFLNSVTRNHEEFFSYFEGLSAPLGMYAVTGNHDYNRIAIIREQLRAHNITLLENEGVWIYEGDERIRIGGVQDYYFGKQNLTSFLLPVTEDDFSILLTHNPDYFEDISERHKALIDLTLAGHLHKGQISFFGLFTPIIPSSYGDKYLHGLLTENNHTIYTTAGLGGGLGPLFVRFFAQPEIVVFTL